MAKKNSRKSKSGPSATATRYTGPIHVSNPLDNSSVTVRMSASFTAVGSTVGYQAYQGTGGLTGSADWTKYAGLYDEYRVLAMEMQTIPSGDSGSGANVPSGGVSIVTNNPTNPAPFTSLNQMVAYDNWKPCNIGRAHTRVWRMDSTEEAQFVSTSSSPVNQGWIVAFYPGATTTTSNVYGYVVFTWVVQFRGRI